MKILHVVQGYTPAIGGTEVLIQQISERLHHQHGDEVTVFTTNAAKNCELFWLPSEPTLPPGTEQINGITVRRFPVFNRLGFLRHQLAKAAYRLKLPGHDWCRALFNGPLIFNMTAEIARFPADLVVASSFPYLHMQYALWGAQRSNKPLILVGALHPQNAWGYDRGMVYRAISAAQGYIAHTAYERDYLISRGISAAKIWAIGGGVQPAMFAQAEGDAIRAVYGWEDAPVLLFVGQLVARKGVAQLLAAMPAVWAQHPQAKLLLAGAQTSYVGELKRQVAQLTQKKPNSVVIRSDFPETEKGALFAASDVVVFPSTEESFGLVFLEAWATQKPVIGAHGGAVSSLITHNVDGLLVRPHEPAALAPAICQLLANPDQRRKMGHAGYQKMKTRYTWDIISEKYRAVYQKVMTQFYEQSPGKS